MRIRIGFDLIFGITAPTPIVLMLYVHPSRERDLERPERLQIEPDTLVFNRSNRPALSSATGI